MSRQDGKAGGNVMVTSGGREVQLRGVSLVMLEAIQQRVEREAREAGKPVDPPVITIEAVGGETEEQVITAAMIEKNERIADEFGEQWLAHLAAQSEVMQAAQVEVARYMLLEGVVLDEATRAEYEGGEWAERQERRWRVQVPTDPEEREVWFLNTVIFPTQEDQFEVGNRVAMLTRAFLDEEMVASATSLFRDTIRGAVGPALGRAAEEAQQVVAQRLPDAGGDGAPLGDDA